MKKFLLLGILALNGVVNASDCGDEFSVIREKLKDFSYAIKMPEEVLFHYQQKSYMKEDFFGDLALLSKAVATPKKIAWTLINNQKRLEAFRSRIDSGKKCAEMVFDKVYEEASTKLEEVPLEVRAQDLAKIVESPSLSDKDKDEITAKLQAHSIYLEGHKNPFKVNQFVEMMNQIMIEEKANGINPTYGEPLDWSAEFKASKVAQQSMMAQFSKLLVALARGETSQFMITGTEEELEEWIVSKDFSSIAPHEMIRASYIINQGDMYLTIMTIENLLSRYWRHPQRDRLAMTVRLRPIINTFGSDGDKFGSWYHLFGVMIYGYTGGIVNSKTVGFVESLGSHILGKFQDEKQEDFTNSSGGVIGAKIAKAVKKKTYDKMESAPERLSMDYYLDLSEDFTGRLVKKK